MIKTPMVRAGIVGGVGVDTIYEGIKDVGDGVSTHDYATLAIGILKFIFGGLAIATRFIK